MSDKPLNRAIAPELLPPEAQPQPVVPAAPAAPPQIGMPGAVLDPASLGGAPAPGVAPDAAVMAPRDAAPTALPASPENQLQRARRLLDTDASQLTQSDLMLIAADDLAQQNALAGGRGGPTHTVKVGESQSFSQQRTKVAPEARAADAAAVASYDQQKQSNLDAAAATAAMERAKAAQIHAQSQELAADNARQADAEVARQQRMQQLELEQQRLAADVAKDARAIDPDRWLHQSGGRTVMAAMAAALGAYGATLAKTPNYALQIINDAIDRDFQGQKYRLNAKQEQQSMQARTIERTRQLFGDQRAADLAARANLMELHKAQNESLAQQYKGTVVEQNALQTNALLSTEQAKLRSQAAHIEDVHQSATTQSQLATVDANGNLAGSGSGKGVVPINEYTVAQRASELKKKLDEAGFGKEKVSPQQKNYDRDAKQQFAGFATLLANGAAMEKAIKDASVVSAGSMSLDKPNMFSDAQGARDQLYGIMASAHALAMSGKSMTQQERADYVKQMQGESDAPERRVKRLRTFIGLAAQRMKAVYGGMSDEGKAQFKAQVDSMGPGMFDAIMKGRPVQSWLDRAYEQGATPHTEE